LWTSNETRGNTKWVKGGDPFFTKERLCPRTGERLLPCVEKRCAKKESPDLKGAFENLGGEKAHQGRVSPCSEGGRLTISKKLLGSKRGTRQRGAFLHLGGGKEAQRENQIIGGLLFRGRGGGGRKRGKKRRRGSSAERRKRDRLQGRVKRKQRKEGASLLEGRSLGEKRGD